MEFFTGHILPVRNILPSGKIKWPVVIGWLRPILWVQTERSRVDFGTLNDFRQIQEPKIFWKSRWDIFEWVNKIEDLSAKNYLLFTNSSPIYCLVPNICQKLINKLHKI